MNILTIIGKFKKEIIAILIFMFCALGLNIYRVQGDGELYYAAIEKILNIPDPEAALYLQKGLFCNGGCAFFNIPFYLGAYAIEKMLVKKPNFNGITLRSASINIASNFYMILSILLVLLILKLLNLKYKLVPILSILFSTSAFTVSVVMPSYTHAVDIFLTTLFLYLMLKNNGKKSGNLFWLGALYPIMITVRSPNLVLIIPLMIKLILEKEFKKCGMVLLGVLSTAWIIALLVVFYSQGKFLLQFYSGAIIRWLPLFPKYSLKLLVHPIHGLFIWSPVTIFSTLGLIKMTDGEKKTNAYLFLSIWILFVLIYGFLSDWHAGWSFSNRYLVSLFPVYVVGLAYFLERYGKWAVIFSVAATFYSVFLFFNWYICFFHGQWETPIDMARAWLSGKSFSGGKVNLCIFLSRVLNLCRYKHLLWFFR